jgi:kynurenine 3-monooxygenase
MRDKTASKTFRAKKKLDHFLEALLPSIYLPLYTMVTFTRIPYAQAAMRRWRGVPACRIRLSMALSL